MIFFSAAQLVWLRQPPPGNNQWDLNLISNKTTDIGSSEFRLIRGIFKNGRKYRIFVVAGRRTSTLTVFWNDDVDNDWTQKHRLKSRIIARYDQFISVEVADLNGDNRPEILATIAAISGKPGLSTS